MFLNPRSNLFNFQFTKNFMPEEIHKKYYDYLNKVPGCPVKNPLDFINYSIQGINLPGLNAETTTQITPYGRTKYHRDTKDEQELMSKEMTITFKMFDGFINYWIVFDLFRYYYSYDTTLKYIPDQRVHILDGNGFIITELELSRILITSLSDLSLNFSANVPEFTTFDLVLTYNGLEINQKFDSTY